MTTATYPSTVQFGHSNLKIIDHSGKPWLTGADLANALGYQRTDKVSQLYKRNAEEFTLDMTDTPKLRVSGNLRTKTRIYSPRGCHLIAMLARTDNAKAFRRWVLDVLENMQPIAALEGAPLPLPVPDLGDLVRARDYSLRPIDKAQAMRFFEATVQAHPGYTSAELSVIMGCRRIDAAKLVLQAHADKRITKQKVRPCLIAGGRAVTWTISERLRLLSRIQAPDLM